MVAVSVAAGGYVGYALTTAWDEGDGVVAAAAAAGPDPADPCHDDDSRPHSSAAAAAADGKIRALQVSVAGCGLLTHEAKHICGAPAAGVLVCAASMICNHLHDCNHGQPITLRSSCSASLQLKHCLSALAACDLRHAVRCRAVPCCAVCRLLGSTWAARQLT